MGDITNPKLLTLKGFLFLLTGLLASVAILLEHPTLQHAFLLGVAVWGFARFYYFAFYVIEHYMDTGYRFAGLWAFVLYLLKRRKAVQAEDSENPNTSPPSSSA